MIAWIDIDGGADGCTLSLYRESAARPHLTGALTHQRLTGLSSIRRPLSVPGIASAPLSNMDVRLDNGDGLLTRMWAISPPLRRSARVQTPAGTIFEGIVTTLQMGAVAILSLEAGMERPLSDNVPLRTSTVWGGWRDVRVLPWAYGSVTVQPIQYSDDQRVFVLCDHPIAGVDEVKRDDVPTAAWAWQNATDSTGRPVAFIELAEPLAEGERLAVTLRGKLHPHTGRLLQGPAEILHDICTHLGGMSIAWSDFDDYRAETAGVVLGGLLDDNSISVRAAIDQVVQSAGGAWAAAMPGMAMAWPPRADDAAPALRIDRITASDMQASADASGIITVLRVLYDYDHAAARYRRAVQVQAPDAIKEYGALEQEWQAPWLRSPRHAEALGQRMLAWLSRPRWRLSWQMSFADIPTGGWIDIHHPLSPVQGRHRLLGAELDLSAAALSCSIEAAVGDALIIETTKLSTAFEPVIQAGITVELAGSEIIFTARDESGQVLPGARITLNGQATRIADAGGRVSFPVARGRHVLLIEANGYPATEAVVTV